MHRLRSRNRGAVPNHLDQLPSEQRLAALLMRSMNEVPTAAALVREIRAFRRAFELCDSDAEREGVLSQVQRRLVDLNAALKLARLDGK